MQEPPFLYASGGKRRTNAAAKDGYFFASGAPISESRSGTAGFGAPCTRSGRTS